MPTTKRQKYLDRIAAKQSNNRTQEERQAEYTKFMDKFAQLGLGTEFEEIAKFNKMAKDWVNNGTTYMGVIPLIGMKRDLVYILTNNKKHEVGVVLKSTEEETEITKNKSADPLKRTVTKKVAAKPPQAQSA